MDNFMICFNPNKRFVEIQNATDCLMARLDELNNRQPSTIHEKIEITGEMIEISEQLRAYENESAELLKAKIESMKGNISRMPY